MDVFRGGPVMAGKTLTAEQKQAAVDAVEKYGSIKAAAAALGIPRRTMGYQYAQGVKAGLDQAIVHPAPQGHTVKGVSTLYGPQGQVISQWVKTRAGEPEIEDILEAIRGAFAEYEDRIHLPSAPEVDFDEDLATVFPVADAHFGLYSWSKETGEDYDLGIADTTNRTAIERLMASTMPSAHAIILGLGDLLHADNSENRTSRSGNSLDVDTRYAKVLQTATLFLIHAVDLALERHGHVTVRNLPGNHDDHAALAVSMALWAWFRNHPRVTVDTDPGRFWWWRFGLNLLGATHGDMTKMQDMPLIMAASRPEDWGQSKHRLILTGHIHHRSAIEPAGVIVESFQSPAARDAWHQAAGYRSGRSLNAITLHKERGEIARAKVII